MASVSRVSEEFVTCAAARRTLSISLPSAGVMAIFSGNPPNGISPGVPLKSVVASPLTRRPNSVPDHWGSGEPIPGRGGLEIRPVQ
jgi:hypothetical protein